jgi:hypothetical protein
MPRDEVEVSTERAFALTEIERCRDSLSSLANSRARLTSEHSKLSGTNGAQVDDAAKRRIAAIGCELGDIKRDEDREDRRLASLNSKLEALRAAYPNSRTRQEAL